MEKAAWHTLTPQHIMVIMIVMVFICIKVAMVLLGAMVAMGFMATMINYHSCHALDECHSHPINRCDAQNTLKYLLTDTPMQTMVIIFSPPPKQDPQDQAQDLWHFTIWSFST